MLTVNEKYHYFCENLAAFTDQIDNYLKTNDKQFLTKATVSLLNTSRDERVFREYDEKVGDKVSLNFDMIRTYYFMLDNPEDRELIEYNREIKKILNVLPMNKATPHGFKEIISNRLSTEDLQKIYKVTDTIYDKYSPPLPRETVAK